MSIAVQRAEYFYVTMDDKPGEGYKFLEFLNAHYVNLRASLAFPVGDGRAQMDIFPEDVEQFQKVAREAGIDIVGPREAFLFQGEDKIGALIEYHLKLAEAGVNAIAAHGVSSGQGRFGYILWVKPEDYEKAAVVLGT